MWLTETLKEKEIANNSNNKRRVKIKHWIELNYPVKLLSRDLGGGGGDGEVVIMLQWNLDITKCQGTDKICLLYQGTFPYVFLLLG